jgi:hypothetical protein
MAAGDSPRHMQRCTDSSCVRWLRCREDGDGFWACCAAAPKLIDSPSAVAAHVRALAVGELLLTRRGLFDC